MERGADIEAGNSFRGLLTVLGELLNSFKEIKPENRTGTIEQIVQNVEAVEKQVQLMGVGMSQNHKCQSWQIIK